MARLYANENFPLPAVEELRRLGHDVLTSYESGRAGQAIPDEDVLAFAVAEARILITLNRKHFVTIQPIEIVLPGHFVPGVGRRPRKADFSQRLNSILFVCIKGMRTIQVSLLT